MKKFLIAAMTLVLLLPVTNAFAYTGGLLNGKSINVGSSPSGISETTTLITDGNFNTDYSLGNNGGNFDTAWITFETEQTIHSYRMSSNNTASTITLYDSSNAILKSFNNAINTDTLISFADIPNVKKVAVINTTAEVVRLKEFDVFGTTTPPNPEHITGLLEGINSTSGVTEWTDNNLETSFTALSGVHTRFNLKNASDLTGYRVEATGPGSGVVNYYDVNGTRIGFTTFGNQAKITTLNTLSEFNNVSYITIGGNGAATNVKEIEFFGYEHIPFDSTKGVLKGKSPDGRTDSLNLTDGDPATSEYVSSITYTLDSPHKITHFIVDGLASQLTKFSVNFYDSNGILMRSLLGTAVKNQTSYSDNVPKSLLLEGVKKVTFSYTTSGSVLLSNVEIYGEGEYIPPPEPIGEIINLTAKAESERVDLSWNIPESNKFKHVNIYRDTVVETSLLDKILGTRIAYAAETKIFETNGTYFNDLTVEPETTYEYTLTTTSTEGAESDGVTKRVTTPEVPAPVIVGGGYEVDPLTGNYIYYWDEPTEGTVKVLVGGTQYKIVDSAAKQISIPKNEMKYTAFGDPDVSLLPIASDGKEGAAVKPPLNGVGSADSIENVKVPFTASDLLTSGTGLLWFVAPIVLLALAFLLVPKLRGLVFAAFTKKNGKEAQQRRFTSPEAKETREEREKREKTEREEREKREARERERVKVERKAATRENVKESSFKAARAPRVGREKVERRVRQERTKRERSTRERVPRTERG